MHGPDFIIGGAPKCGTTSLHRLLATHPDIGIPEQEINHLDADDPVTHPDFPARLGVDYSWYEQQFAELHDVQLRGEDSTTYLFSDIAPARIKSLLPNVRLIFLLRDPVDRAYSQYWHLVVSGRCTERFTRSYRKYRSIIEWSIYAPRLARYLDIFGRERIKIVLFEDLIRDPQGVMDEVTNFLDVGQINICGGDTWHNRTIYPRYVGMRLFLNHATRIAAWMRDRSHARGGIRAKLATAALAATNCIGMNGERPPMETGIRQALSAYLSDCNVGLSELVGQHLSERWPSFSDR